MSLHKIIPTFSLTERRTKYFQKESFKEFYLELKQFVLTVICNNAACNFAFKTEYKSHQLIQQFYNSVQTKEYPAEYFYCWTGLPCDNKVSEVLVKILCFGIFARTTEMNDSWSSCPVRPQILAPRQYKMALTFESVDEILKWDNSTES